MRRTPEPGIHLKDVVVIYELACPHCQGTVSSDTRYVGRPVKCPLCQGQFIAPAPPEEPPLPQTMPETGAIEAGSVAVKAPPQPPQSLEPPPPPPSVQRFRVVCRRCGSLLEAHTGLEGQTGRCPTCSGEFPIPCVEPQAATLAQPVSVGVSEESPMAVHAYAAAGVTAPEIIRAADGRQVVRCPRCAFISPVDAGHCHECGLPFSFDDVQSPPLPGSTNGYAAASLVMGLLGMPCFVFVVPQILAIVFGIVAFRQIDRAGSSQTGIGPATAGIVCGVLSLVITITAFYLRMRTGA